MSEEIQDKGQDLVEGSYVPTLEESLLANEVVKDFHDSARALQEKHSKFSDFLEHYRSIPQVKRPRGMANISIPMAPPPIITIVVGRLSRPKIESDVLADSPNGFIGKLPVAITACLNSTSISPLLIPIVFSDRKTASPDIYSIPVFL